MGRKGKGFLGDLRNKVGIGMKGKRGGAWYNNWNDFKSGAKSIYEKIKPVHHFVKSHKLISRAARAFGKNDFAKDAEHYGYGIRKKRC